MMPTRHRPSAGFSLLELLIAMILLVGLTGGAYAIFASQSRSFRGNVQRFDLVQNARSAMELTERVIRTMGAGVTGQQPMLVYGRHDVLAFNSDYVERDTVDMRWAAYWNPDAPVSSQAVWDASTATPIPNSTPGFVYPSTTYLMSNGVPSPAETYLFYFRLDDDTPRSDDYALWQRVNAGTPEVVARNVLPAADGSPFFEYLLHRVLPTGDTLIVADPTLLPLIRRELTAAMSGTDSANAVRPDSVRAIRMNYRITNGRTGLEERTRSISAIVETPNNGMLLPTVCGRAPLPVAAFAAVEVGIGLGRVALAWTRSTDQDAGEMDVRQYVVWRRVAGAPTWGSPIMIIRAEPGTVAYGPETFDNVAGTTYEYAIAAQDCTPAFSSLTTATVTMSIPAP